MATIGIFDSGIGGLTVFKSFLTLLPENDYVYLGDMARLPYGTKGPDIVTAYAVKAAEALLSRGVEMLVVACNTVSAYALPTLRKRFGDVPIFDVISSTVSFVAKGLPPDETILVLATEATARSRQYEQSLAAVSFHHVHTVPTTLLVSLAEEGWVDDAMIHPVIARYLAKENLPFSLTALKCVILGCTHFPVLQDSLQRFFGKNTLLIDSADPTAQAVYTHLGVSKTSKAFPLKKNSIRYLVTDLPERFCAIGSQFLPHPIDKDAVEVITL